jgi:hypothetical protein
MHGREEKYIQDLGALSTIPRSKLEDTIQMDVRKV